MLLRGNFGQKMCGKNFSAIFPDLRRFIPRVDEKSAPEKKSKSPGNKLDLSPFFSKMRPVSDAELIQKYLETKDVVHVRTLLERYESQLLGYLIRILNGRHDAEDALQETFCKALRALPKYRESNQFKSWIYRIAHNEAMNVIRARGRVELREQPVEPEATDLANAATDLIAREDLDQLEDAITQLPDAERRVVMMRMKSDLAFKEIAKIENCSINTVLGRMHNAKKRLRELMEGGAA